ncbi:hypothetical protein A4S02_13990 (plasmid) [Acetobacter ascendens]|uniref:Uncharacterized protein n=1 Tax=Acetobacter ascendens TaxID=481146 RepID=A0A1D8R036_9PROT|nr:hypothetical protein [Acetobacter ascendens]AOW47946.1 hypothetical protein A4S02_13990 [Acetobacter ascendens]
MSANDSDGLPVSQEDDFTKTKWVRVMGEYSCEGIWERNGCPADPDELPITDTLRQRLLAWADRYNDYDFPPNEESPPFDLEAFSEEGLTIARAIKAELPEWTVIYFDEFLCDYKARFQPRSEYEYEVECPPT